MKTKDLKSLTLIELKNILFSSKNEYIKLKMKSKISTLENPIKLRIIRRDIARIKTFINQKTINENKK